LDLRHAKHYSMRVARRQSKYEKRVPLRTSCNSILAAAKRRSVAATPA
jgi:hypothetical protein